MKTLCRHIRMLTVALLICGTCALLGSTAGAVTLTIADTSISVTQARDGMTVNLGYQITSNGSASAQLVATMTDPGGKIANDMGSDYNGTAYSVNVANGTNWYYRDFFINLPPNAQTGATKQYDVKYTVKWGSSSSTSATKAKLITMLQTIPVRVPILMYHKVQPISYSIYYIPTADFQKQIAALKAYGYTTITYQQLMNYRAGLDTPPAKPIMLTFDDGYENYYTDVVPSADPLNFNTTCFVITGKVDGTNAWDTGDNHPVINHLTWPEIDQLNLDPLVDQESHTVNHPALNSASASTLRTELQNSRSTLRSRLGKPELFFCYPYGSGATNSTVQQAVRDANYFMAVNASGGVEASCYNKYALSRVAIYSDTVTDYNPSSPGSFFFTKIGDPLTIPSITIDAVQLFDATTGNPIASNQAMWGQTVRVRVTAMNNGAAIGAGASLVLTAPGNVTMFDSYAADPAHEPTVTSWIGEHSFEWTWTVPLDAPIGAYTVTTNFHDQFFLLGFGKIDSPGFYVQSNVLDLKYVKLAGDGTWNTFRGAVVTAAFPDYFYIESARRAVGIRVEKRAHGISAGTTVDVAGMMTDSETTGERCILASFVNLKGTGSLAPVATNGSALGGGPLGHQKGVWKWQQAFNPTSGQYESTWAMAIGLNNVGLLIRMSGRITSMDAGAHTLVIEDGSGSSIKCVWDDRVNVSQSWTYVTITGVSSCENASGQLGQLVLITSAQGQ